MVKDMTKGNIVKLLIGFAVPLFFGNLFQQLYSVADTAVVGRGIGVDALASVGSTGSLTWLIMGFITGLTHGFSVMISQSFGKGDYSRMRKTVMMSAYLSAAFSVVISILGVLFTEQLFWIMSMPEDIYAEAAVYFKIIMAGITATIFYNITASILRALGDSMSPLIIIIICSFLNIGLDLLFVFAFGWGVAGAAWATVISQLVSGFMCIFAMKRISILHMNKEDMHPDGRMAIELLKLGLPVGVMNSITAIGMVVLQKTVNTMGSVIVAAYTVGTKVINLADQALCIIGMTLVTFVGQNMGAGDVKRTREGVRRGLVMSLILSAAIGAALIVFGRAINSFFVSEGETAVVEAAYPYLITGGGMIWSLGVLFVYRYALQGMGETFIPMLSGLLELAMRLSMVIILPESLGFWRICIAEVSAWFAAGMMLYVTYFIKIRQKNLCR